MVDDWSVTRMRRRLVWSLWIDERREVVSCELWVVGRVSGDGWVLLGKAVVSVFRPVPNKTEKMLACHKGAFSPSGSKLKGFPPLKVVSRGDWQKNQYRSLVPFLRTLVPYPNQRRKSYFSLFFDPYHTSWPEMVMEKFVGICRPRSGSGSSGSHEAIIPTKNSGDNGG